MYNFLTFFSCDHPDDVYDAVMLLRQFNFTSKGNTDIC